mgnify:CR=1 FL=1
MEQKYKVEQIFTKNYARLCAMATAILHDSSLAQDAVQEGWIRLHKAKQLDTSSEEKLEHLILITVRHAAYNIMRKGNPEPIEDSILNSIPDTSPSPHEIVESREVSRKIKNSLRNLSETDRSIIQLQYGQGYTSTQIAALLDQYSATASMENEKNAQSGVRERRYYTVKNKFDELLIAVCEDMQKEELEAFHAIEVKPVTGPNLKISKKRYKSVYMAAAVVAAVFLFATAAVALWPELSWNMNRGSVWLTVRNAPDSSNYEKMQIQVPSSDYSVEELDENAEIGYSRIRVTYSGKIHTGIGKGYKTEQKSFVVTQYSFASVEHEFTDEDGNLLSEIDRDELQNAIALKKSVNSIQPEDIISKAAIYWVTDQSCYRFYRETEIYDVDEAEKIIEMIKSIKP